MQPFKTYPIWIFAVLVFVLGALGCSSSSDSPDDDFNTNTNDNLESATFQLLESEFSARLTSDGLSVVIPIHQEKAADRSVDLTVGLTDLDAVKVTERTVRIDLSDATTDSEVTLADLPEDFGTDDKAKYIVTFNLAQVDKQPEIWGSRSLHAMYRYVQAQLLGSDSVFESSQSFYKLIVSEPNSGLPVQGAQAAFFLTDEDGLDVQVGSGTTDEFGMADVKIELPAGEFGDKELKTLIDLPGGEQQEQAMSPLAITREAKILLTTDKPMYQPGQTIHIRGLCLKRPALAPEAGLPVTFSVFDAKGNKVFKDQLETSEYGVASTEFKLATILNEGSFKIEAKVGEFTSEKTVTVERYALPKFSVGFTSDKTYYRPGNNLHGSVQADYFFGQPVAGGSVEITAQKFDVELTTFATITGVLDADGGFEFDLELPTYFVAQELDQDQAYAFLEIAVIDTAGHQQIKSATVMVVENAILLAVVPESGSLVPGVENTFYLMATDPFGKPVNATIDVGYTHGEDGNTGTIEDVNTGLWGLTTFTLTPEEESLSFNLAASLPNGDTAQSEFSFSAETAREYVMLRTDRSIYKVGDSIQISVLATNDGWEAAHLPDRVYLDVIKDGQTMLMTTLSLTDGASTYTLDIDATLNGSIELMAYYLGAAGEIIRDRRLVFVELGNSLTVEILPSKDTFAPAEEASVSFRVKDADNNGVQSVIGVQVVDEAVFALQDMKPGMEKVYFALEEELMQPRYEIHGFDAADLLDPEPEDQEQADEREAYAGAFLASAGTDAAYGMNVNTFAEVDTVAKATATEAVEKDLTEITEHIQWLMEAGFISGTQGVQAWIEQRNESEDPLYDPWGHAYKLSYSDSTLELVSNGMDEKTGTDDDITVTESVYGHTNGQDDWRDDDGALAGGEEPPMADGEEWNEQPADPSSEGEDQNGKDTEGEGDGPRVRSYFPETLYVNPAVVTDAGGEAEVSFTMADSITSWRMTALANTRSGQIGSNVGNVIVYQDFFIDIDFPATLTQNDIVHVPIAIYNYLSTSQTISLEASEESWIEYLEGNSRQITVGPNSVTGIYFPVKVVEVGWHELTVNGIGDQMSDAIRRSIEVIPDGLEVRNAVSGRLDGDKSVTATIPADAIADASKLWVKVYPGLLSQVIEGLDSLLQMPSGCFEQTSSSTYPNVLVLDYMILTGQITPEIELNARDKISQGYQRLLSYEVDGGGFEWFGSPPAHRVLTAYGLLEFSDMAKVHNVDDDMIARTQDWLAGLQNSDGSYDFDAGGIHEGAVNNFTSSKVRTTAYITWALAESGYDGPEVAKGASWVKANVSEAMDDNYSLGLIAMMLATINPNDSAIAPVTQALYDLRIEDEDGKVHWDQEQQTEMYGTGGSAGMETTALIGQALIKANSHVDLVGGITDWLVAQKGSFGEWSTTAGTIQALRFFIATLSMQGGDENANATVTVMANGSQAAVLTIDADNSDVLQQVVLTEYLQAGENEVNLVVSGEGNVMYSVVSSYWLPSEGDPYQQGGPITIDVEYDKTTLAVNDIVTATASISNVTDSNVLMVLVDLGLPPGFDLMTDMLNQQVQDTVLQRFEKAGRQLILYVERIDAQQTFEVTYQLLARYPMDGTSGSCEASPYYEPESKSNCAPTDFVVEDVM